MIEDRNAHFSPGAYLKDRAPFIILTCLFVFFLVGILSILNVSESGIFFIVLAAVVGAFAFLVFDYVRQATFWRKMEQVAKNLEKGVHFNDLVDDPSFLSGRIARDVARTISSADNQEITDLKAGVRANAEYIELWVHEAKTPLAAAQLISKRMTGSDALALRRELERMAALIEQALFAARTESLASDYLIREVDLLELIKEACKTHMHYLTSRGVALEFHIEPDLCVYADKTWLEFIITQIVINAAKYDSTLISFSAYESEQESSSSCTVLEIKDNGCGIPASDVPRVFDRGFTGEVGRAHGSATGMGLYLAARMCASMGLSILLASEEGVGTRVQISFPHDRRRVRLETSNLTNP